MFHGLNTDMNTDITEDQSSPQDFLNWARMMKVTGSIKTSSIQREIEEHLEWLVRMGQLSSNELAQYYSK